MKIDPQSALFNEIKSKIGSNRSLVNEIADLLEVSTDSAYRRIRNEKQLTLDELSLLTQKFGISLDNLMHIKSGTLLFNYQTLDKENPQYIQFLQAVNHDLNYLNSINDSEVIIAAKDFPIFYNFFIPEISGFKSFFWKKTILQLPEYKQKRFDPEEMDNEEQDLGKKIAQLFCRFKTHQLWNEEVFTSFINQVQYYYESGFITNKSVAFLLYDKTLELIDHFLQMAENGTHYLPGKSPVTEDSFQLYQNDVIFGDNTIIVNSPSVKRVYFTHNVIDTLYTHDEKFIENSLITHRTIMNRSVLLSKSSERERNRFFKRIRDKIESRRKMLD